MQTENTPIVKDLVLLGGGHAHALVLRMWAMKPQAGVRLTVINPEPTAPYTGMLPGFIAGHYTRKEIMIDLVRLARFANARLILDRATLIDPANKLIHLQGRAPLGYDLASLDVGITSDLPMVPGFSEHVVSAKPLGQLIDKWEAFVANAPQLAKLVVLGAGVGGVELAMAMSMRLQQAGKRPQITVVEKSGQALPQIGFGARAALQKASAALGISFRTHVYATGFDASTVTLNTGERLAHDFVVSVAGARPHVWLGESGLALQNGFVTINPLLKSSDPSIFAVGDCAEMTFAPRPKAGVFAVRQAPVLFHNLQAVLADKPLKSFAPQRDYLKLVSLGGKSAVADKFGLRSGGKWQWALKDWIDRAFMAKFDDLPRMHAAPLPPNSASALEAVMSAKPLCAGCGSKLGATALSRGLAHVAAPSRADVISGPGDDAAVLQAAGGVQVISTDHLRSFTHDPRLMARIAALHAMGDIWAMGAQPQVALAQVTLPRASDEIASRMLAEIMQEASATFQAAGADVVGGHSTFGAELTIGFTVTGLAPRAIAKSGAIAGDALILTKPIGTGVILAAEMAMAQISGLILGEVVAGAYASMTTSIGPGAAALAPFAHAMTDVTGFGLLGHLLEILEASSVGARLDLGSVPVLDGAQDLVDLGYGSSLETANRAATLGRVTGRVQPKTALLYDPQTGGGLLAIVPQNKLDAALGALRTAGQGAWVIGQISAGPVQVAVV
ncbi:MAG: selenide, water dikinase SelD [Microgenomates group bacterium]